VLLNASIALLPVLLFLGLLVILDSFKLVRGSAIAVALGWGAMSAVLGLQFDRALESSLSLTDVTTVRYAGPVVEETLKLLPVWLLLRRRRIGFPVDAGVIGFAVGTGFGLVENLVFLHAVDSADVTIWIVRGLGTAILHGGTTSLAGIIAKMLTDRAPERPLRAIAAGWTAAVATHSAYNHLLLPPVAAMLLLLIALPLLIFVVFERSEAATRDWVGAGLDLDVELLQLMASDRFHVTRYGTYLSELRQRFPSSVVVDMFCMLRLELELSVQVKALLLAREAGLRTPPHQDIAAGLEELDALEASIGMTGMMALAPLHVTSHRDQWHRYVAG
jgi:RsiW-degrading membrane proteinase PrsW (M82 family)